MSLQITVMNSKFSLSNSSEGSNANVLYMCDYCLGEKQNTDKSMYREFKVLMRCRKNTNKDCCGDLECTTKKKLENKENKKNTSKKLKLKDKFPNIFSEWNDSKNNINPSAVLSTSRKSAWWKCSSCGYDWEDTVESRTLLNNGCPKCKPNSKYSLGAVNETLSKEWHTTKNGDLTPFDLSSESIKRVWWKCNKGHEWQAQVKKRNNSNETCPDCKKGNGKITPLENSLGFKYPELTDEWDSTKNNGKTVFEVAAGSHKKAWWVCKDCSHEWDAQIKSRTFLNSGCPACNLTLGESKVDKFLKSHNLDYKIQYEFANLKGSNGGSLKFDFAILDKSSLKLLIEYDGEYHFSKLHKNDGYETIIEHDNAKNKYCIENNIPLIRIPYWEIDNIERILNNELIKYNILTQ